MDSKQKAFYILIFSIIGIIVLSVGFQLYVNHLGRKILEKHANQNKEQTEETSNNNSTTKQYTNTFFINLKNNKVSFGTNNTKIINASKEPYKLILTTTDSQLALEIMYQNDYTTTPILGNNKNVHVLGPIYDQKYYRFVGLNAPKNILYIYGKQLPSAQCRKSSEKTNSKTTGLCFTSTILTKNIIARIITKDSKEIDLNNLNKEDLSLIKEFDSIVISAYIQNPFYSYDFVLLSSDSTKPAKYIMDIPVYCEPKESTNTNSKIIMCDTLEVLKITAVNESELTKYSSKPAAVITGKLGNISRVLINGAYHYVMQKNINLDTQCTYNNKDSINPPCGPTELIYKNTKTKIQCLFTPYADICDQMVKSLIIE